MIATLTAAELIAVTLAAPLLLFPTPARLTAALVIVLIWCARYAAGGDLVPPTRLNAPLLLLLLMVGVSVAVTFDLTFSLGKIAGVLLGAFVFWAIVGWTTTPSRLALVTLGFLCAGSAFAVIALVGTNWSNKFPALDAVIGLLPVAIRGLPGAEEGFQPNGVAGLLVLFIPLQLALLLGWRRATPGLIALHAFLLILTAGTLVLTQSRGAVTGMAVAGLACLLWSGPRARIAAFVALATTAATASLLGPATVMKLVISRSGTGIADSLAGRLELWDRALAGIRDFPITGMGINAFRRVMPVMYPTALTPPDVDVAHAHNHLIQAALDLGLPGLAAYLWIWTVVALLLIGVYRRSAAPGAAPVYRAMAGGLGAGLIAHFCFGLTDAIALGAKAGILFWFTLALAVALHRVATADRRDYSLNPAAAASLKNILTVSSE